MISLAGDAVRDQNGRPLLVGGRCNQCGTLSLPRVPGLYEVHVGIGIATTRVQVAASDLTSGRYPNGLRDVTIPEVTVRG